MNIQSLLGNIRKKHMTEARAKAQARRKPSLKVETLEGRVVPATLPAPLIDPTSHRQIHPVDFSPTLVADPNNAFTIVQANQFYTNAAKTQTIAEVMVSRNAGESFQVLAVPSRGLDPKTNNGATFTQMGTPSVAFDRFGNIFVTYAETNDDSSSGRIVLRKYNVATGFEDNFSPKVLYRWADSDQAHNPYVAVDANLASYQDPEVAGPAGVQHDPFQAALNALGGSEDQVRVFVAWNTVTIAPTGAVNFNPNVIKATVSSDGGASFAAPVIINNDRYSDGGVTNRYSQPKMIFTPGRTGFENISNLTDVNGTLFYTTPSFNPNNGSLRGIELWKTDGTSLLSTLVRDIWTGGASSSPSNLTNVNGTLYFTANDGVNGIELWKSNGTSGGTVLVKDIRTGVQNSSPRNLLNVNGTLYFTANDGVNGEELWKSDGSAAGTVMVRDILPGEFGSKPKYLTNVNGTVYFSANNGTSGEELWKSDGTAGGTVLVSEIVAGAGGSSPLSLTNVNGTLYFSADDGAAGRELWKSDGTSGGTVLIEDINLGSASSGLSNFTAVGSTLFFTANDGTTGVELWSSDGSAAGTALVRDIFAGINDSLPAQLTNVNGVLFFQANNGVNGVELWKSNGTLAGTVIVRDIVTNVIGSNPLELTNVNNTLYFKATNAAAGEELWKSDGSLAGTVLVRDIRAGAGHSSIESITAVGTAAFFTANDGQSGLELWRSTGTTATTTALTTGIAGFGPLGTDGIGGALVTTYADHGGTTGIRVDTHALNMNNVPAVIDVTNTAGVFIQDAINGDPADFPTTTTYNINVPQSLVGGLGQLTTIDHIAVTLNIDHDDLAQLQIILRSPDGKQKVLVRNRLNTAGQTIPGQGISGTSLGVVPPDLNLGVAVGTTFIDNAARFITDGNLNATKTGDYRPEGQPGIDFITNGTLNGIYGQVPTSQIDGNWQILVTDMVNSGNTTHPRVIRNVTLRLSQNYEDVQDADASSGAAPAVGSATGNNYPNKPASNPGLGIGPGVSVAVDNTLGAYSMYQGRMYMAFTTGTQVQVRYSDDNGQSWSGSTIVGPGFQPVIEVDDGTGTLMLAYYSTQGDASGVRSAVMYTTAINQPMFGNPLGRIEFGTPQFINAQEEYFDQIRTKLMDFEPIRSNPSVAALGPLGYGNNVGLVSNNGRVTLVYTGNLNTTGTQTRTQKMRLTAGARAVTGDTGPILGDTAIPETSGAILTPPGDAQITQLFQDFDDISQVPIFVTGETFLFNNTFAPDGLRRLDGFTFELDRIVDPRTVTTNDIVVKYHAPDANPALFGENISDQVLTVERLDFYRDPVTGEDYGSKRYFVRMTPQARVGSYSYSVGSDIRDRIRELARDYELGTPQNFNSADTPILIEDFIDPDIATPITSTINVVGVPGVIGDINVRVNLTHGDVSQLQLVLIPPVGPRIALVNQGDAGPGGPGFSDTEFDDDAAQSLANDVPPYTSFANYKPAESLSQLFANTPNGGWTLEIIDLAQGISGVLNNWRLTVTPATLTPQTESLGNLRDQDGDAVTNEPIEDIFAVPNPVNGVPFVLPYKVGSLPITITGPRLMETAVLGAGASLDNVVVDKKVKSLDLRFDRIIDASTFGPGDILRIIGPIGDIPITGLNVPTVTPISGLGGSALSTGTNSKFFRIAFKEQDLAGNYRIQIGSQIADTNGNLLDTDQDAGVAQMTGGDIGTATQVRDYSKVIASPIAIAANGVTNIPLTIDDAYLIKQAITTLTINHSNVRNLTLRLYGPTTPPGAGVLLMTNTPLSGSTANLINTTFDDGADFPIQTGSGPFPGSYNPIQPIAQLNNTSTQGTWRLEILNKGSIAGTLSRFDLSLTGDVIGTGLGETNSDQVGAGFRIHVSGGGTSVGKANWSPLGPAGHWNDINGNGLIDKGENNDTVGRVSAIAVDPTDPSGNTVYAAGASGGVWRTTNFLTRDAIGPTWVPLTDFGPTNAINIGSLVLYPSVDKDPSKTTILVGTGSDPLNRLEEDEMFGDPKLRFDGVGFLLSADAGKTWQVLDSSNNFNSVTNKFRPVVDKETATISTAQQVGTTVTITTAAAHGIPLGATVTISGVSVAGYNGTFVVTSVISPTKFTYTTTSGLSTGTGGTAVTPDRRDHIFVGAVVNKLVVEDKLDPVTNLPIMYAAVGQGTATAAAAGLWRSQDGGRTWVRIRAGEAVDFALSAGSVQLNSVGRPTVGYLSLEGEGMFRTVQLNSVAPTFTLMGGGIGRPQLVGDLANGTVVSVDAPPETPNGNKSRIVLGVPTFVTGDPLANSYYQRWVYALVAEDDGQFDGLYLSKDAGDNWTRLLTRPAIPEPNSFFTDFGGTHSVSLVVDPTDPNIVYIGSDSIIRVDATFSNDPYNISLYQHSNADGGVTRNLTRGGVDVTFDRTQVVGGGLDHISPPPAPFIETFTPGDLNGAIRNDPRDRWNQLNSLRDPFQPFLTDTALFLVNTSKFFNDGADTVFRTPSVDRDDGSPDEIGKGSPFNWTATLVSTIDPLTGKARILIGTDEGIGTFVNDSTGLLNEVIGFDQRDVNLTRPTPNPVVDTANYTYTPHDESEEERNLQIEGVRNGNLQVSRLFSGDVQPSLLAASIAHSFSVAAGRRQGDVPVSDQDVLDTGNLIWGDVGRIGRANYVTTDQTGSGTIYILRRINDLPDALDVTQNFFQIQELGGTPISRTNGLFRNNPADQLGLGQWDNTVRNFSVNPVDPKGIIMGSNEGRLFRTVDKGLFWDVIAEPGVLDGSYTSALAFGSPLTENSALNDHIYAGTEDGNVFVTTTGGGALGTSWTDISNGLAGSGAILKIIANPTRGTLAKPAAGLFEAYLVAENGVYYMKDWSEPGATWVNVTNNLPDIQHQAFNDKDWELPVVVAQQDTPELLTIAVDWRPTQTSTPQRPILYAGGDGGAFRGNWITELDGTQTVRWIRYTNPAMGASSQSGGLPLVKVMDLDLAVGNIDPNTGKPAAVGSVDMLVATTLGRGQWAIAIGKPTGISGPRIVAATPTDPQFTAPTFIDVEFDTFMSVPSFTADDVTITGPNGETIVATLVEDITAQFLLPGELNLHNKFRIHFPALNSDGSYIITIGTEIFSDSGIPRIALTDGGGTPMNQDNDGINGEPGEDAFRFELVVGTSDMADFIKDVYQKFVGRLPTVTEYKSVTIKNMEKTRLKGLTTVIKELLIDHNSNEARTVLVERLFDNGNATGEIGNLLPAPYNATTDIANFVLGLENGSKTPEKLIIDILSKSEYFTAAGGTADGFLTKVYADLFKGLGITPAMLSDTVRAKQLSLAGSPTGRAALAKSLVNGATVKYDHDLLATTPRLSTNFRTHFVRLTYAKYLPNYTPTTRDISSGKSLMAKAGGIGKLGGSENLIAKVLSTKLYFESKTQVGGQDNLLHTNRSWVAGVIFDRMDGRVATAAEQNTFSQKVLDTFAKQRQQFVRAVVFGTPYRTKVVNEYFQLIHTRTPTATELKSALNSLKAGTQIPTLMAGRFASNEFKDINADLVPGADNGGAPANTWARAVYITLFGAPPLANEEAQLASQFGSATKRKAAVLAILKSTAYRTKLINDTFNLLLGRPASTVPGNDELGAYLSFLSAKRWELMYADILSYGAANFKPANPATTDLPREFWEVVN